MQSKNPCRTPLYGRIRGSIRNLKAVCKNHPQPQNRQKKIRPEPTTACKTVKTDNCSHPSSQNPNRSDTVLTCGAYRGFAAIAVEEHNGHLDRRENGIQIGQSENFIENQIRSPLDRYFSQKPKTTC